MTHPQEGHITTIESYVGYCQVGNFATLLLQTMQGECMGVRLKVKEVATRQGFSQRKLSLRSGVDLNTVRRLFQHPDTNVSVVTLGRLATTMGVDVSELIESVPDVT